MARWSPVTIAGGAYSDDARPWACQDTVNYIPVPAEREGTRSAAMLRGLPGFTTFCATMQEAPVRGLHNVEGLLLAVTGNKLYSIGTDGAASEIGTVPGVRRVTMAHNQIDGGHEVMVANGQSGYVYKTTDGSFAQVTDEGFPGLKTTDFVDGYIAGIEPAGRYWFHSQLLDATSYNTLDRYDAESAPDKMVALVVSHREVLVLNERSGAFFRNSGSATGTFQNSNGMEMEVGCAATHAVARLDNSVFWLGSDGIVYRLAGHQPQRVSTGPVEQAISRCDMANAFAFTFEDRGHKVFYLTFPDGHTWGYDVWTGEWHRRQSKGFDRWRLSSLVKWNGAWIGGDFSNGRLYQLDWAVQHEAGEELMRRRVLPVLHDNANDVIVNALRLIVDTGLGSDSDPRPSPVLPPLSISGSVPDGYADTVVSTSYVATGGVQPITFAASDGFPDGLTLDADTGEVTGAFSAAGAYAWTITATDADGTVSTLADDCTVMDYWSSVDRTNDATGSMALSFGSRDAEAVAIIAAPTANLGVRGSRGRSAGRYYVEFEVLAENASFVGFVGLAQSGFSLATDGYAKAGTVGHDFQTRFSSGITGSSNGSDVVSASIVGVAVDLDAGHAWVHLDGVYAFAQTPDTNPSGGAIGASIPSGTLYPVFTSGDTSAATSNKVRLRLLESQMAHMPSGFSAWGEI